MHPMTRTLELIQSGHDSGWHTGAQLCVIHNHETVCHLAWGETAAGCPMSPEHAMLWLSASKPILAVALGQLAEKGQLDWHDPVAKHLPEFGACGKEKFTLAHLLTHTIGLRPADLPWSTSGWSETVQRVCSAEPEPSWVPGHKAAYHASCTWHILGEVLRRITSQTYSDYVRENIFEPAGMRDSFFSSPQALWKSRASSTAPLWVTERQPPTPHPFWNSENSFTLCRPGASGRGPARDLARFYAVLASGGAPLLATSTLETLTARHRQGLYDETFLHRVDWGYGFMLDSKRHGLETVPYGFGRHASDSSFGHSGSQSTCAFADPAHRLAVAWCFNGQPGEPRHQRRQRAINSAIYEDLGLLPAQ